LLRARLSRTLRTSLCAACVALAGCGSHHSQAPSHPSRVDLESIFQEDPLLRADPAGTLELLRRLGVDRVRVSLLWARIAPDPTSRTPPANFDPSNPSAYPAATIGEFDAIVRAAASRGIGLYFTLTGPAPLWAAGRGAPRGAPYDGGSWKPSAAAFGAFVHAIATRYDGRYTPPGATTPLPAVRFWSIWNEPNYGWDLAPQAIDHSSVEVSPRLYRGLVDAAWSSLHASGHADDTVLIGETAPRGQTTGDSPGNFSGMVPLRFIRALYCVDGSFQPLRGQAATLRGCPPDAAGSQQFMTAHPALFEAGGFADHPYPQGALPPNQRIADEPDYADLAALPNLESTLDRARAAYGGRARMPIYSTEFGYQTEPPSTLSHIDPTTAATYLNWSEYISWLNPRLRSYDQYLLVDPPSGNFPTGLEFANRAPKPTYDAFRMPLWLPTSSAKQGQPIELWGCVRPAPYAAKSTGAVQRVRIELRRGAHGNFATVRTVDLSDPHGYFDIDVKFDRSGQVRLAWTYPHGPTIHSRTAAVVIH
jgi:hypothetical protein